MKDTAHNRTAVTQEVAKLRAIDSWFSDDAGRAHVAVIVRHYPDIATVRAVMVVVLETCGKIPRPTDFLDMLNRHRAEQRGTHGFCSTCGDTGFRTEQRVKHEGDAVDMLRIGKIEFDRLGDGFRSTNQQAQHGYQDETALAHHESPLNVKVAGSVRADALKTHEANDDARPVQNM